MTTPGERSTGLHPLARHRIRAARMGRGLSQREVARRIGLSASMLSQIENGKSEPSVSTLYALGSELAMSLDTLLDPTRREGDQHAGAGVTAQHRRTAVNVRSTGAPVVRPDERRTLHLDSGVAWERLTRGRSDVDVLLATYEPGGVSSSTGDHIIRRGREYAYLIDGDLTLEIGGDTYELRSGDSLEFDATVPHLFRNLSDRPASGVWLRIDRMTTGQTGFTERRGINVDDPDG